jgi:hypothetical protein
MALSSTMANSLRGNYSLQTSALVTRLDSFGGAVPPPLTVLAPKLAGAESADIDFATFDTSFYSTGPQAGNRSTQLDFGDDFLLSRGRHQLKFGADYRAIYLGLKPSPILEYLATSVPHLLSTAQADLIFGFNAKPSKFLFQATSLYAQDTWKVTTRLTLTYGLRWELNPAPSGRNGTTLAAWANVNDPAEISLAPAGSPLWGTTYTNVAPRVGVAYSLTPKGDFVLRGGWGIFYDLGTSTAGFLGSTFPNSAFSISSPVSLPLTDATPFLPVLSALPPYPDETAGFTPNLKLPRSFQWNVALEKAFLGRQAVSLTYVGQAGRNLLRLEGIRKPNMTFAGDFLLTVNNARSNYNALQLQYRRPFAGRLQALLNYTWSHSLDNASGDTIPAATISNGVISAANDYASSNFDVRNSFSGALSYAIPAASKQRAALLLTRDWSVEAVVVARSGFPFNAFVPVPIISGVFPRPNLVTGQPIWIPNPAAGGGKSLNPAAFTPPPAGQQGTEGRNDIPGFGLTEVDLGLRRKFPITERLTLLFRTDAFNVFNHPNFTNPSGQVRSGPNPLQSQFMLNKGLGGLGPLFQGGGPRSLQLSLKLSF